MKFRVFSLLAVLFGAYALLGHPAGPSSPDDRPSTKDRIGAASARTVRLDGLAGVEFGETEQELLRRGALHPRATACGQRLTGLTAASPVFADHRLVLLWADPPLHTPEGVAAGSPVQAVRTAYPDAARLVAPGNSYRFDGLLARRGDRAYLFLHDGRAVRKMIAGYADYARQLFDEGFGLC